MLSDVLQLGAFVLYNKLQVSSNEPFKAHVYCYKNNSTQYTHFSTDVFVEYKVYKNPNNYTVILSSIPPQVGYKFQSFHTEYCTMTFETQTQYITTPRLGDLIIDVPANKDDPNNYKFIIGKYTI